MKSTVLKRLLVPAVATSALGLTTPAIAADYEIDAGHTFVTFEIAHLGISTLHGRFNDLSGGFTWDKDDPASASIQIAIDPASVDTNHAERDKHLRSDDFLHVEEYPEAGFRSTGYEGDADGGKLTGELTLHGVTKPVTIDIQRLGEGPDPWGGYRAGFVGTASIKRADFDMDYDLGPAAETMTFELTVEGVRK